MRDALDDELYPRKRARYDEDSFAQSTQQSSGLIDDGAVAAFTDRTRSPDPQAIGQSHIPAPIPVSSPETIQNEPTTHQPNLRIPAMTRDAEKAKRRKINQAQHFLKTHPESSSAFQIGSLPSSWSTEPVTDESQHREPSPSNSEPNQPTSQLTNPLSIASSAFSSQDLTELPLYDDTDPDATPSSAPNHPRLKRSDSSRIRREAYLAARADNYEAWSSVALLSAGNNHTEEEEEL